MEAVCHWIKHNDLEKIVRRFEISTTVKFCSTPQKICHYTNDPPHNLHGSSGWIPIIGVAPIESDSASSGSEHAYCTCLPGCCQTLWVLECAFHNIVKEFHLLTQRILSLAILYNFPAIGGKRWCSSSVWICDLFPWTRKRFMVLGSNPRIHAQSVFDLFAIHVQSGFNCRIYVQSVWNWCAIFVQAGLNHRIWNLQLPIVVFDFLMYITGKWVSLVWLCSMTYSVRVVGRS